MHKWHCYPQPHFFIHSENWRPKKGCWVSHLSLRGLSSYMEHQSALTYFQQPQPRKSPHFCSLSLASLPFLRLLLLVPIKQGLVSQQVDILLTVIRTDPLCLWLGLCVGVCACRKFWVGSEKAGGAGRLTANDKPLPPKAEYLMAFCKAKNLSLLFPYKWALQ